MNITDLIQGAVASRTTRFAFELLPPLKGDGTRSVFGAIDPLMDFNPAYINVTFHREALKEDIRPDGSREWHIMRRRPGTVGISAAIRRKYDVEVVPHLICGGWSKYDIEDSLIDMDFLGLHNVLALRGDKRQNEPRFVPYAQGHAHAADLVRQIQAMNRGEFIDGEVEECHHSKFSVGVAGYPEKHFEAANPQSDLQYLKEKVDAGADYIVTQMFFDNSKYFDFVERCRKAGITVPIIPGIKPISGDPAPHLQRQPARRAGEGRPGLRRGHTGGPRGRDRMGDPPGQGAQGGRSADHPFLHDGTHGQHPQDRPQRILIPNRAK